MAQLNHKKSFEKIFYSRFVLVFFIVALIFFVKSVYSIAKKDHVLNNDKKNDEATLSALVDHKNSLTNNLNKLSTNAGIEENIRDKYRVVKDGEGLVVIVDNDPKTDNTATASNALPQKTFWQSIKSFFGF